MVFHTLSVLPLVLFDGLFYFPVEATSVLANQSFMQSIHGRELPFFWLKLTLVAVLGSYLEIVG